MTAGYYVDTSIWIDLYEDRRGYIGESLGDYALKLLALIKAKSAALFISDMLVRELEGYYSLEEINGMLKPFEKITKKIVTSNEQRLEARRIANERGLPPGDVLHAIVARDNNLILVSRDNDFRRLGDVSKHYKPEELI